MKQKTAMDVSFALGLIGGTALGFILGLAAYQWMIYKGLVSYS